MENKVFMLGIAEPHPVFASAKIRKGGRRGKQGSRIFKKGAVQPGKAANFTGKNRRFFLKSGCILQVKFALLLEESHKGSQQRCKQHYELFAKAHRTIFKIIGMFSLS